MGTPLQGPDFTGIVAGRVAICLERKPPDARQSGTSNLHAHLTESLYASAKIVEIFCPIEWCMDA
jgi:hypothetical protein